MAEITCALNTIAESSTCNDRPGVRAAYWANYSDIDWDTMAGDPLDFDTTNQEILDYVMLSSAVFYKVNFERKGAFADFTYTRDQDFYNILVTLIMKGKDMDRRNSLTSAIPCCNVVLHLYMNDGTQRVVGVEWTGDAFQTMLTKLSIVRHLDSTGQVGTSRSRDEVDLGGESTYAPLFASVAESALPLT